MKVCHIWLVMLITSLAYVAQADASIQVGDRIKFNDGVGSPGGIFHIHNLTDPFERNFGTLCVEITEFVNFSSTYAVENIGWTTVKGGKTLNSYTAWLYNEFREGTLQGFDNSSVGDVNTLQLAIWLGIGYLPSDIMTHISTNWYNTYNTQLSSKPWQSDFSADTSWSGIGSVRIMNLRKVDSHGNYTDYAQDQLVRMDVPEPLSVLVWLLLSICVCGVWVWLPRRDC